jgi:hypothetical protein
MYSQVLNQYPNMTLVLPDTMPKPTPHSDVNEPQTELPEATQAGEKTLVTREIQDETEALAQSLGLEDLGEEFTLLETPEAILETVRKRQAGESIVTADILHDFYKTMKMLGISPEQHEAADVYFDAVREESQQPEASVPLMKQLLLHVAKRLDAHVTETLKEPSTVVSDWLDALFLQPIRWQPATERPQNRTTAVNLADRIAPQAPTAHGITVPSTPILPDRVKYLYLRDAMTRLKQFSQQRKPESALQTIESALHYIRQETVLNPFQAQWERLHLFQLKKMERPQAFLDAYEVSTLKTTPTLETALWAGEAYAKTGQVTQAIKHVFPHLGASSVGLSTSADGSITLQAWVHVMHWASQLSNPILEKRMGQGLFQAMLGHAHTLQHLSPSVERQAFQQLSNYQTLLELQHTPEEALRVARFRAAYARQTKQRHIHDAALRDVVGLLARSGHVEQAQQVLQQLHPSQRVTR